MTDTIKTMELRYADTLTPSELMVDDLIKVNGEIVEIMDIADDAAGDIYFISYMNDFGETEVAEFAHDAKIKLYILIEEEE